MKDDILKRIFTMLVAMLFNSLGKLWKYLRQVLVKLAKHAIKLLIKLLEELLKHLKITRI